MAIPLRCRLKRHRWGPVQDAQGHHYCECQDCGKRRSQGLNTVPEHGPPSDASGTFPGR